MPTLKVSDEEFVRLWQAHQSISALVKITGVKTRGVMRRRRRIEAKMGIRLMGADKNSPDAKITIPGNGVRVTADIPDGDVIVFSDSHYWPGPASPAHKALVRLINDIKPVMIVANGDIFDGAQVSRHDRIGWETAPSVKQELEAVQERMGEIEAVAGNAKLHRTHGNHCLRFETRLASAAPQYEGVAGMTLADHLPRWQASWSIMVNGNTMIKHRIANGIHAAHNNTLKSGISTVTGHLHSLKVWPWDDYNGTRYGVDTGTLADPWGPQFAYMEDGPRNHRSGFAILHFRNSELLYPSLAKVLDDSTVQIQRTEIMDVGD